MRRALDQEPLTSDVTSVDIVVPVFNEERALPGAVRALHAYLGQTVPYDWTVTIADNGSTDGTPEVAKELAATLDRVRVLRLEQPGRGRALRTSWSRSEADIVAYMDVDLSTSLDALPPLLSSLASGHSDISIGSRLAPGARTVRSPRREFLSRVYNKVIRWTHRARFRDAQCGFKAVRREAIMPLLPHIADDAWFFDTEMLLLGEHNGLRIHEVPVDWVEDLDSTVRLRETVWGDIAGLVRVGWAKMTGSATVPGLPRRHAPHSSHPHPVVASRTRLLRRRMFSFATIGLLSTLAWVLLYALLREVLPPLTANLIALTITTFFNTEANKRFTFQGYLGSRRNMHFKGFAVFASYYLFTSGALLLLDTLTTRDRHAWEVAVLLASSAVGTSARYLALGQWVFDNREPPAGAPGVAATASQQSAPTERRRKKQRHG
jgi:glycosyltransferase involved in cell wall biosynthesis